MFAWRQPAIWQAIATQGNAMPCKAVQGSGNARLAMGCSATVDQAAACKPRRTSRGSSMMSAAIRRRIACCSCTAWSITGPAGSLRLAMEACMLGHPNFFKCL